MGCARSHCSASSPTTRCWAHASRRWAASSRSWRPSQSRGEILSLGTMASFSEPTSARVHDFWRMCCTHSQRGRQFQQYLGWYNIFCHRDGQGDILVHRQDQFLGEDDFPRVGLANVPIHILDENGETMHDATLEPLAFAPEAVMTPRPFAEVSTTATNSTEFSKTPVVAINKPLPPLPSEVSCGIPSAVNHEKHHSKNQGKSAPSPGASPCCEIPAADDEDPDWELV